LARNFATPDDTALRRDLACSSRHLGKVGLLFRRGAEKAVRPWPGAAKRHRAAARSCHHAMKRALSSNRADDFHEWRKKAKRLLLLLRVVELAPDRPMREAIELVDKLQSRLGYHHDLVVLEGHLDKNSFLSQQASAARNVLGHIHRQRAVLEKRLGPLGRRCHRAFARRLKI
jgi:CHAD domain-containing protein